MRKRKEAAALAGDSKKVKKLRSGFTTGTCAAAAVKAAVLMLRLKRAPEKVVLSLPDGKEAVFPVREASLAFEDGKRRENARPLSACCAILKDAGDDPDVTDGVLVYGRVSRIPDGEEPEKFAGKSVFISEEYPFLYLTGGEGIGLVTKKGLPCAPGFYAINPVPRKMIWEAAAGACAGDEKLLIEISIPEGKALAERTFNPKLGILGGISVLGTSGIVNPMSEEAIVETIRLEIRVKAQEGRRILAVAPGNYGETFLKEKLSVSMDGFVKCSNFIGETFAMMRDEGIKEALLAGHVGKLIKVAGGVLNTHSRFGDRRMEIFGACAGEAGALERDVRLLSSMNTTEEAAEYLKARGLMEKTAAVILRRIQRVLRECSGITPEVVLFSSEAGILGMTDGAIDAARRLYIKADEYT